MKIGFVSLGCPKNLVDSEVMLGMAEKDGHEITSDASQADVLVVNTCAFIDRAKQESIDTILEMAELKKQVAGRRLVVTGCMAERYRDELKKEIPEIDAIYGTGEVEGLSQVHVGLREPRAGRRHPDDASSQAGVRRRSADLHLRRGYAAQARHARSLRLREDRRGLRLQVRLLHHPEDARALSQPADRLDREGSASTWRRRASRSCCSSRRTRTFYGIDRGERGALPKLLRAAQRRRRHRVDPPALSLSHDDQRRSDRRHRRPRQGREVHRPAAAACLGCGA